MPAETAQKLTKKQRKGLAFRQKKGKGRAARPEPEDVPESENLDVQEDELENAGNLDVESRLDSTKAKTNGKVKGKERKPKGEVKTKDVERLSRKRKRAEPDGDADAEPDAPSNAPSSKRQKRKLSEIDENVNSEESRKKDSESEQQRTRYILFVGNLKYTTSKEAIQTHFAHCDPPPTVRLLTPKSPSTTKSKGCAFLEFTHRNALQQALKLHHSSLDGRQINVELTAGGGGKSASRLDKVRGRNRELEAQRVRLEQTKHQQKDSAKSDAPAPPAVPGRPQRHSSTSGTIDAPAARRTWSVPEAGDEGRHRGGIKHVKKRGDKKGKGRKEKDWGTGVNAIPVG